VTAAAVVKCSDPARLARAMGRHFGHKVRVEQAGAVTRVFLARGEFELEPGDSRLVVRATAAAEDELADVQRIVENHLARFARPDEIEVGWDIGDPLELATLGWIASYRNAEHLVRTRDWLLRLDSEAGLALRLAALTHDIERHFPGGPIQDLTVWPDDEGEYRRLHSERSAQIVGEWLRGEGGDHALVSQVERLILTHESGGKPDEDLVQAADSLSFLEVNPKLLARWYTSGRAPKERAKAQAQWMFERIRVPRARKLARPLYEEALAVVDRA
jgi:hypothetical protein